MFYNIKIKKKKYKIKKQENKIEKFRKIKKSIERVNIQNRKKFTYLYIYNLHIGTESQIMYTITI